MFIAKHTLIKFSNFSGKLNTLKETNRTESDRKKRIDLIIITEEKISDCLTLLEMFWAILLVAEMLKP